MSEITPLQPPASPPAGEQPVRGREGVAALLRAAAAEQRGAQGAETPPPDDETEQITDDLPQGGLPPPDLGNAGIKDGTPAPEGEQPEQQAGESAPEAGGGDTDEGLGTLAMDGLAERAGLTLEELFNVELPLGDEREPVTLGALKDKFTEMARVDDSRTLLDEQRTDFENQMIRSRQELRSIVQMLGPNVPPQLMQAAEASFRQNLDSERDALRAAKPEWKDPETFRAAQDEMLETITPYGYSRQDLDFVMDHRLVKLVYDYGQLQKRFKAAQATAKEITGGKTFPGAKRGDAKRTTRKRQKQEILQRARTGNTQDKVQGVAALLRGE